MTKEHQPNKVYIIQEHYEDNTYSTDISNIKELNPDKILILSNSEYEVDYIFRNFTAGIDQWLTENNKTVIVLAPGFDRKITDNIIVKPSYGHYLVNYHNTFMSELDFTDNVNKADKRYTLYCNRRTDERIQLIDAFARENLLSDGIVTFRYGYSTLPVTWQYHDGSPLIDEEDFLLNSSVEYAANSFPRSFLRGLVDVVCESRIDDYEYYPTEKTMKSVIALKPFIALSCQYYHRYLLEDYGIEPYTELFDYSFDDDSDINNRIEAITENIKRIKDMPKTEIYAKVKDKVVYNRQKFIDYGANREKLFPKELEFISDNIEVYGNTGGQLFNWVKHAINMSWINPSVRENLYGK